jgi:hypothetical protein
MKNDQNYYVNGLWFDLYNEARTYADFIMESQRRYYAIFTRAEIEAHRDELIKDEGQGTPEL